MHQAARVESMPMVATQTPLSNAWRESVKRGPQLLEHWEKTYFKSVNSQKEKTEDINLNFWILSVRHRWLVRTAVAVSSAIHSPGPSPRTPIDFECPSGDGTIKNNLSPSPLVNITSSRGLENKAWRIQPNEGNELPQERTTLTIKWGRWHSSSEYIK